jgi:hypothetical protein
MTQLIPIDAWKTVGHDVDLEDLNPMMDGQSHRARLMDTVRSSGGQKYTPDDVKVVNPLLATALGRASTPPRGPRGGGRGGGVIGSRGRGGRGSNASPARTPSRRLDPALDPGPGEFARGGGRNTGNPFRSTLENRSGHAIRKATNPPPPTKTRRVVPLE